MAAGIRKALYGGKKQDPVVRMNRAAGYGRVSKLYAQGSQPGPASEYASKAAHEVASPRMRKAIRRSNEGRGDEVTVRAYTRSRPR